MTILEVLEAHAYVPSHLGHAYPVCLCLEWRASSPLAKRDEHRDHLAEVLETHQQEAKAAALEEAAAELAQESDAASHTARKLSGDDNTRYHAYSSAYSVAAYKLENRAAQLKGKP